MRNFPLQAAANPATNTIYFASDGGSTVAAVNGQTNTVTASIPVGLSADAVAANPEANTIDVTNNGDDTVSVISGRTNTVIATISARSFEAPDAVAVDGLTNTAYGVNYLGTVSVLAPCPA